MSSNEIMLIFKLLKMFLSSLNWLEFQFIQALNIPKEVLGFLVFFCIRQMVRKEILNH